MKKIKSAISREISNAKRIFNLWFPFFIKNPLLACSYLPIWIKSMLSPENKYDLPWMTFGAIDWFEKNIKENFKVFEWGTGGSTLYYAKKTEHVCSIEHDAGWHSQIKKRLADAGLDNCDYRLVQPEKTQNNKGYASSCKGFEGQSFEKYCKAIELFPDDYFDLIVIDGRARVACAALTEKKIKGGGHIVLDNADIEEYSPIFDTFKGWEKISFSGPVLYGLYSCTTAIFKK